MAEAQKEKAPVETPQADGKRLSAAKDTAEATGYYNTNVKKTSEFDFRMTGSKARGLACGPSQQVVQHHFVLPSDHPAAAPSIMDEVGVVIVANLLEKGVELKLDDELKQSVRSVLASAVGSKIQKATESKEGESPTPDLAARYDPLIAILEKDKKLKSDSEKMIALELLRNAKKANKPLKLLDLTLIVEICSGIDYVDRAQAVAFITRMHDVGAITAEQVLDIMEEIDSKFIHPLFEIKVQVLRLLVEVRAGKKK